MTWEYKVIAGRYTIDQGEVSVENPQGRSTLQRVLDFYGSEGYDVIDSQFDSINKELVLMLKRPKGGVMPQPVAAAPAAAPAAAAAAPDPAEDDDMPRRRRRGGGGGGGRRRSKADLDRLYRDD